MDQPPCANFINKMQQSRVLVIGDIMLDRFIYGDVSRISPESPVPVLSIARENQMLGGAGNVLANLAGLKTQAKILSVIGLDDDGKTVKSLIADLGFDPADLIEDSSRPTTVKTRYLAGHQQLLRTDFEKANPVSDETATAILTAAKSALQKSDVVILSDYGKGMLRADIISGIIELSNAADVPVIVDPKGQDFSIYRGAYAVTPNKKELSEATDNHVVETENGVISASHIVIEDCGIDAVVATRSADGMSIIQKDSDPVHFKGAQIEVFDVSGAGDTVIATIAAALAAGATLAEAAQLANMAGSIVVTKVGTAPIRTDDLLNFMHTDNTADRVRKGDILDWEAAAEQVKRWQAQGLKVGFTNGCFDILHYGHVTYLNDARDHCDRLVMGLNKDSSISILKGPERPVHDENSRATVIAALGSIDTVVLFGADKDGDDNTAIKLLETLKPDIYFKGGDYTEDQIPEAPTVRSYGGDVKVMPIYEGHSTTNSITKMKNGQAA